MKQKYDVHDTNGKNRFNNDSDKKYTLDEALQMAGHGCFNILIIIMSGIALMGATIESISVAYITPYANCDLKMTTLELGLVTSIAFCGFVVSSHFWGFMADTWGRKKVIRLAATLALLFAVASAFTVSAVVLILLRFCVGIFISGLQASVFSYVSEFHTKETAPKAASFVSMFMPVIFMYSSIVGIAVIPMNWSFDLYFIQFVPWRLFIIIITSVNLTNTIIFSFLPESPKFLLAMNKHDEALGVLMKMYEINTGNAKESYPVQYLVQEGTGTNLAATKGFTNILKLIWNQTKPIFIPPYLDKTVKLCFMVFTLFAIGHGSAMWFPDFLIQLQNNTDPTKTLCDVVGHERVVLAGGEACNIDNSNITTFQVMFCVGALFTVLSFIISFYLNKLNLSIVVPGWIILSGVCSVLLNYLTQFHAIVIAFITFLSSSLCAAIIGAISVSLFPTNVRAMATCFIFMFGRIGGLVGGNLVGLLVETKCNVIFNVFFVLSLACAGVFLLIKREPPPSIPQNDESNNCSA